MSNDIEKHGIVTYNIFDKNQRTLEIVESIMIFKRDKYLNQAISKKENGLVKVITGARRSGKSYFLNTIFYDYLKSIGANNNHIIKFAFDNDEDIDLLDEFLPNEPTKIIKQNGYYTVNSKKFRMYIKSITSDQGMYYLLLDEIQMLESFAGTLNGFLGHKNFDIYVTGSNSQMLSSEVETQFRGRKSSIHMLPLSFKEFYEGSGLSKEEAWRQYIVTGGIPLVYQQDPSEREQFLKELCYEVYLKDIIGRKGVENETAISNLFGILASCIGSGTSPTKLEKAFRSKNLSLTNDTIGRYINHFSDSFVVSIAKKYDIKGKAYIDTPYKIYFEDIGVRNARLDFHQIEETHLMENTIYNELRYRDFNVSVGQIDINEATNRIDVNGKKIYAKKNLEVDFIATKGNEKYYIQSCYNLNGDNMDREKRSLSHINDSFKKVIITKDGLAPRIDENGYEIINIFDFLLSGF